MKCLLVEIRVNDFNGGYNPIRLCTAPFNVVLDGNTYIGAGDILEISDAEETAEISKNGITLTMSGVDPVYQNELASGGFVRAPIDIITANVPEGSNVVDLYYYHHRGYCDTPLTQVDYKSNTITIGIETTNVFTDIDRIPDLMRCSMASHSSRHSGDKFFQYTADVDLEEVWKD